MKKLSRLEQSIKNRRPYYNKFELQAAGEFLEKQSISTGYSCVVDASIEQLNYWFPKRINKRPKAEYGIQLMIEFPNENIKYKYPEDLGHINFWEKYKKSSG